MTDKISHGRDSRMRAAALRLRAESARVGCGITDASMRRTEACPIAGASAKDGNLATKILSGRRSHKNAQNTRRGFLRSVHREPTDCS